MKKAKRDSRKSPERSRKIQSDSTPVLGGLQVNSELWVGATCFWKETQHCVWAVRVTRAKKDEVEDKMDLYLCYLLFHSEGRILPFLRFLSL